MSASNKILTVSYGTFSCTIEGFEDPFGTMKQIAEYFRDLAAEDRYFGAEPPVPDAEALRHIAERETARRVEARMASGAVHLRRLDDAAAAATAMPVGAAAEASTAPAAALTPSEVIDPAPASVAERLSRIRAVVARARTQPLWPEDDLVVPTDDEPSQTAVADIAAADAHANTVTEAVEPAWQTNGHDAPETPVVPEGPETPAGSDPVRAEPAPPPVAETEAETGWAPAHDPVAAESDAPADVSGDGHSVADAAPGTDAEWRAANADETGPDTAPRAVAHDDANPGVSTLGAVVPDQAHPVAAAPDYVRPELPVARVAVLHRDDHAAATATGRLEDLLSGRIDTADLYDDEDAPAPAATPDADARLLDAIRAVGAAAHDVQTDDEDEAESGDGFADERGGADDRATFADAGWTTASAGNATDWTGGQWREAAEVDASLRDAEAAMSAPEADWRIVDTEVEEAAERRFASVASTTEHSDDAAWTDPGQTAAADEDQYEDDFLDLDTDDGAPLLLRSVDEADTAGPSVEESLGIEDDTASRTGHDQAVEDLERRPEESSVDRLLAATNSQLESTEVNRRRSAIAHLKAAVAAARADRRTDEPEEATDDTAGSALDKFREDLARVVRPRRPVEQDQVRPSRRLPPLMLVSEQRIDVAPAPPRNEDAVAGPVRPRRVVTRDVGDDDMAAPAAAAQGGFADFAQSMGARDLPDMIEAAAAYTAFVEGRPSFSRPQLMQMMRGGDSDDAGFSREEQLRSFGLLLRQGRIQKLKRGQFTVADDTRFRPPHRHAGE